MAAAAGPLFGGTQFRHLWRWAAGGSELSIKRGAIQGKPDATRAIGSDG